jgi:hypothetical protein
MKKALLLAIAVLLLAGSAQAGEMTGTDGLTAVLRGTINLPVQTSFLDEINASYSISDAKVNDEYYPQEVMIELVWKFGILDQAKDK